MSSLANASCIRVRISLPLPDAQSSWFPSISWPRLLQLAEEAQVKAEVSPETVAPRAEPLGSEGGVISEAAHENQQRPEVSNQLSAAIRNIERRERSLRHKMCRPHKRARELIAVDPGTQEPPEDVPAKKKKKKKKHSLSTYDSSDSMIDDAEFQVRVLVLFMKVISVRISKSSLELVSAGNPPCVCG
eukprot:RCo025076